MEQGRGLRLGTYKTILNGTYRYNKTKKELQTKNAQQNGPGAYEKHHYHDESKLHKAQSETTLNKSKSTPMSIVEQGYARQRNRKLNNEQGSNTRMHNVPLFIKKADFLNQREDLGEEELDALVRDIEKMESSMNKKDHYNHSYTSAPIDKHQEKQKSLITSKMTINPNTLDLTNQNSTLKKHNDKGHKKVLNLGSKKKLDNLVDLTKEDFENIHQLYHKKLERKVEQKMNELEKNSIKIQLIGLINPETQNLRINLHNA